MLTAFVKQDWGVKGEGELSRGNRLTLAITYLPLHCTKALSEVR